MARGNPLDPIPHPPRKPLIGNLLSVSAGAPVQDLINLARECGPIFWLDMMGKPVVVVSGFSLVDELCDEARFDKSTRGALRRLRPLAHGLFTSDTKEPNWSKAHHILLPTFAQRAMQGYHGAMLDLADQLCLKWERLNHDDEIDVTDDMTRLTLDTIGLCGFDYRFNSFYRDGNHPFVDAMARALETTMETRGLPLEGLIHQRQFRQLRDDIRFMHGMVETIIRERREAGHDAAKKDLMSLMLSGVDKRSGQRLDDRQIRDETITFLIAGHETTSGLLSFATYALLNNPDVLEKCYAEVDRVLGSDLSVKPTYQQVNQLTYVAQVLKETLRLWPTAPAYGIAPLADTTIGGQYKLKKRYHMVVLAPMLHRDKAVWGEDAELFNPDNFSREAEMKRPINAYKPFGNGQRACIGRQFALQEAALVMGMVLQRFNLIDHTRYQLKIKETLTIKPDGLKIKVRARTHRAEFKPSEPIVVSTKAAAQVERRRRAGHQGRGPFARRRVWNQPRHLPRHRQPDLRPRRSERLRREDRRARRLCRRPARERHAHRHHLDIQRQGAGQRDALRERDRREQDRRDRAAEPQLRGARLRQHPVAHLPGVSQDDGSDLAPDRRQGAAAARRGRRQWRLRRGGRALDGRAVEGAGRR